SAVKSLATTRTATPMAIMPRRVALLRAWFVDAGGCEVVAAIQVPLFVPGRASHKSSSGATREWLQVGQPVNSAMRESGSRHSIFPHYVCGAPGAAGSFAGGSKPQAIFQRSRMR